MTGITRTRTAQILTTARRLVTAAGGHQTIDGLPAEARRYTLISLYKQLQAEESVAYDTARRRIAQALRLNRNPFNIPPDNWGGDRSNRHE